MFVCPECGLVQGQGGACPADGTALAARGDDPIVGTTVGVYRIARLLGVGGMGRVYKGVHPQIGSRVAVKVLSRECADRPELVERFFSEARAVNLIRHESIVNVLDLNQLPDGRPYIIMEYLDGSPLADIVAKAGPLPLGGLARLASECLDALGAAHAKGIVHRDLKPDNIYVTPAGHGKVLDFGIAKLRPEMGGSFTQTGSLLGTPHYMSPEQAMGRGVDHRTDLYAMGVILFECATGQKPFNAESLFDLLRKHVDVAPPMPRALRPDMPPAMEQVILATLAKDPNQRFGSAGALAQALQASTQGLGPEQWVPVSPATAQQMSAQRTPVSGAPGATPASWPHGWTPIAQQAMPGMMGSNPATGPGLGSGAMTPGTAPGYQMQQGHPSTVSSGQMVPKPVGGSKKGLWIGVGLVAVVGGAIAIAVAAGSGGDGDGGSSTSTSTTTSTATGTGTATGTNTNTNTNTGDGDEEIDKQLAELDKQLDSLDKGADEALKKQLAEARNQLAEAKKQLDGVGGGGTTVIATPPPPPPPSDEPYTGGPIALAGFDPKAFDLSGFYAQAEAEAKKIWPDAKLWRIDAEGVMPDGKANITLAENFSVLYRFISPSKAKRPDDVPMGVKVEQKCVVYVNVDKDGIHSYTVEWECKDEHVIRAPKCSAAQVWQKAIKLGAPGKNAVGELGYRTDFDGNILWYFDVADVFSETIPDNC